MHTQLAMTAYAPVDSGNEGRGSRAVIKKLVGK